MRVKYYLNKNWKFTDSFEGSLLIEPMEEGTTVELPHTFCEASYNYVNTEKLRAQCIYQRTFHAKKEWQGKRLILTFEGVAHMASIYINGVNQRIHKNGSTPFDVEIGSKVNYGEDNLITVLVDSREHLNQPPFLEGDPVDVIPFGGIYREVYLTVKEQVSIENVYYQAQLSLPPDTKGMNRERLLTYKLPGNLKSNIRLSVAAMRLAKEHRISVRQFLNDTEIAYQPLPESGDTDTPTGPVHIWDIDSPVCYRVQTDLLLDDMVIDTDVCLVGFRALDFSQSGFYLNGRKVKIRGIVRYQSYPYMGYAMPESMQRLDARILKEELHVNAVRCCGEYPSPFFLDECDKRGILVFCEVPGYRNIGDEDFQNIHLNNVEEMVIAGRNHPSIFLWGTRINGAVSSPLDKLSSDLAHSLDPLRSTAGERLETSMQLEEDVYSYTDFSFSGMGTPLLSKDEVTSNMSKPYLVSGYLGESLPVRSTDSTKRKAKQILYAASVLDAQSFMDDICGSFAICMCDHLSFAEYSAEDGMTYHGILDSYRNKKPVADVFSSQNNVTPELNVYPPISGDRERWEGFGEVYILTNMDSVRVYRDGEFVCEYFKEDSPFGHMRHGPLIMNDFLGEMINENEELRNDQTRRVKKLLNQMATGGLSSFILPGQAMDRIMSKIIYRLNRRQLLDLYEKYVSKSHEYRFEGIKNGRKEITTVIKPSSGRFLKADLSSLNLIERHTYDVVQIRITVNNESGEVLYDFNEPIIVNTHGPVKMIGPALIPLRGGMAGAYIRSDGKEGEAEVILSCADLAPIKFTINILCAPSEEL